MHHIFLVLRHEIATTLRKRSFWFTTFIFPLLILAFSLIPQLLTDRFVGDDPVSLLTGPAGAAQQIGYVDQAGILTTIPADLAGLLEAFPDRAAADQALQAGAISQFYLLPADFMQTGEIVVVAPSLSPLAGEQNEGLLRRVVAANLLHDEQRADLVLSPLAGAQETAIAPAEVDNRASAAGFGVSFALMFILFFSITMSSGYMLQSVVKEKENRTAEVLLTSLEPQELMIGKVIGLGCLALLQMAIWVGGGRLLLSQGEALLASLGSVTLPAGFWVYLVLYFLLGYLVYSSELGAIGALAPSAREGSQFTFVIILPLLIPLWFNSIFLNDPNGTLATVLSLFPLTAPTAMVTRLASTSVPVWQPLLGLILLAATAWFFIRLSARFFRADTLLSDTSLNWARLRGELRRGVRSET
ncbi:MAG: ABC transporter permease [Caldilineales bacterium]